MTTPIQQTPPAHTATTKAPWYIGAPIRSPDAIGICVAWQDGEETGEETIAEVLPAPGKVAQKQAAFIVTACNSFDSDKATIKALAASLADMMRVYESVYTVGWPSVGISEREKIADQARAALAACKQTQP